MDVVRFSIEKPVPVMVGIILVVLFGLVGLFNMPYQLSPTVIEPEITVTTLWPGATPYEVEKDILNEQEKVLKGIPGLVEMEGSAMNNRGTVTLRFKVGTDVDNAVLRISNKLDEVPSYPENVERPVILATGAAASPVIWVVLKSEEENPVPAYHYKTFFENEIRQYLERVEGVAELFVGGGTEQEMHITVDPERLASYRLTVTDLIQALRAANRNVSAGTMGVGRRDYRIRTVGQFNSIEDVENVVIRSTGQQRMRVKDIAEVRFGYAKPNMAIISNAKEGISLGVKPEPGTNILELTDRVEEVVLWLNENRLQGEGVYLDWVYDQRPYIRGAIDLVRKNIFIGGALAVLVLLLFLRSLSATVVVASAIPISIIGTFIFMNAMGRNLNVVSLAGISFAIGMLVDSAIVVLENIDRHRKMNKSPFQAAYDGTREVWGAIFASTLTTVAVFLPVLFVKEEAGQLFQDIAIAVTFAILLSLTVSVTVIPMLSNLLFGLSFRKVFKGVGGALGHTGDRIVEGIMGLVGICLKTRLTQLATIAVLTGLSIGSVKVLMPQMEYLPLGNRNFVLNILIPPPGLSYEEKMEMGEEIFRQVMPHYQDGHKGLPGIKNMFYVATEWITLFGATSQQEQKAGQLVPLFTRIIHSLPGVFGVSNQAGIFETRFGRGRTIDVDLSGEDIQKVIRAGGAMFGILMKEIPQAQVRPIPSLELLYPEIRFHPIRDRLIALGMNSDDLGVAIDVLMDGRKIGEFKQEGKKGIDLVLKASKEEIATPEELAMAPLVTPRGDILPVNSLARVTRTTGISEMRHLERKRTVTLQVTPPKWIPLEQAMETIEEKVFPLLRKQNLLQEIDVGLSGAADKLTETRNALQWNFILAALIVYLLMSALFGNFLYPLVIMFTVPLAAAGGFVGLSLVNLFSTQPLDVLTMLGFVILIGVVVNNAILLVHQSLVNVREYGMELKEAILDSTRIRIRPIYMSACTSIFGMLPLVVRPGPGSELYRGLGSVVLGGIALSTVFTIFVIPSLLLFFIRMEKTAGAGR